MWNILNPYIQYSWWGCVFIICNSVYTEIPILRLYSPCLYNQTASVLGLVTVSRASRKRPGFRLGWKWKIQKMGILFIPIWREGFHNATTLAPPSLCLQCYLLLACQYSLIVSCLYDPSFGLCAAALSCWNMIPVNGNCNATTYKDIRPIQLYVKTLGKTQIQHGCDGQVSI